MKKYSQCKSIDAPSLRERKKQEARRLLAETAVRLFARKGFDKVTIAEIAAAANVSDKTVFNYFATKEDLVLTNREELDERLLEAVRTRPEGESLIAAVRAHTLDVALHLSMVSAARRADFRKVIYNTPSVLARMRQLSLAHEEALIRLVAAQVGQTRHNSTIRAIVAILGTLSRLAYGFVGHSAEAPPDYESVVAEINAAFDLVERGLAGFGKHTLKHVAIKN